MNKTRFAIKAFAAGVATTILVLGSVAGPAEAKNKDTGWNPVGTSDGSSQTMKDTGWNPV